MRKLAPAVCSWAGELMKYGSCLQFAFDTYDREVERYGGPEGMAVAESLLCADSRACAALLGLVQSKQLQLDRMTLAIASGAFDGFSTIIESAILPRATY